MQGHATCSPKQSQRATPGKAGGSIGSSGKVKEQLVGHRTRFLVMVSFVVRLGQLRSHGGRVENNCERCRLRRQSVRLWRLRSLSDFSS